MIGINPAETYRLPISKTYRRVGTDSPRRVGVSPSFPVERDGYVLPDSAMKGEAVPRSGLIWTIVGVLLIIALLIYIL
jgi:hypothetical protein